MVPELSWVSCVLPTTAATRGHVTSVHDTTEHLASSNQPLRIIVIPILAPRRSGLHLLANISPILNQCKQVGLSEPCPMVQYPEGALHAGGRELPHALSESLVVPGPQFDSSPY